MSCGTYWEEGWNTKLLKLLVVVIILAVLLWIAIRYLIHPQGSQPTGAVSAQPAVPVAISVTPSWA